MRISDWSSDVCSSDLNVPSPNAVLRFSYVGFRSIEERIGNRTTINVALVKDVTTLEQIVVVGYGTQERKDLTGSISSVSADEIKNQPMVSIDQRSEEHTSELQSLMRISYAVFCLKKKTKQLKHTKKHK